MEKKFAAGQDAEAIANDLEVGARLFERAIEKVSRTAVPTIKRVVKALRDANLPLQDRLSPALTDEVKQALDRRPLRDLLTKGREFQILVEPVESGVGAWYEFFPVRRVE